jgi:hypothetical protein
MKIEYIDKGSEDCPLIMISDTTPEECKILQRECYRLSKRELKEIEIHKLKGCIAVNKCQLLAKVGEQNKGIIQTGHNIFQIILEDIWWDNVAGLIEPFCKESSGFQWLDETSKISLLLSPTGHW